MMHLLNDHLDCSMIDTRAPTAGNAAQAVAPEGASIDASDAAMRVLVVEDNPVNAEIAIAQLHEFGCDPVHAVNGEEAVAQAARQAFDLILMDCQMPVMDGYDATRCIRSLEAASADLGGPAQRVPIVALTANALPGDRARCLAAGMDDHMAKPFKIAALRATVEHWGGACRRARRGHCASTDAADRHPSADGLLIGSHPRHALRGLPHDVPEPADRR